MSKSIHTNDNLSIIQLVMSGERRAVHIIPKTPNSHYGCGSIKICSYVSSNSTKALHIVEGNMNGAMFWDILGEDSHFPKLNLGRKWKFQDNDAKHIEVK